jgi:hypothetical protein
VTRFQSTFLALVITQAAHSTEEYVGHLYEVFAPARFVSGLFSGDPERGFLFVNVSLVLFGLWCVLWPVRRRWPMALPLARVWIAIELVNGVGHPVWSLVARRYTPGVITAVPLLILAILLWREVRVPGRTATAV